MQSMHGRDMPGTLDASLIQSIGLNCGIFDMHGQPIEGNDGGAFSVTLHSLAWVM